MAALRDGTLFAILGQAWGETYDPNAPGDEYAHRSKSVDAKTPYMMMVSRTKVRPYVFWYDATSKNWQANALAPGDDEAVMSAMESAYQDYWAACHHFFPKSAYDPLVHNLPPPPSWATTSGEVRRTVKMRSPNYLTSCDNACAFLLHPLDNA